MGVIAEPPPQIEIAQARDLMFQWVEPLKLAQLKTISLNLKLDGTISQQEAFKLTVYELYGIASRASLKSGDQLKAAKVELAKALDERILSNRAYDKFKTWIAAAPDPLLPQ